MSEADSHLKVVREPALGAEGGDALVAIDVPIGLTDHGPRVCDLEARRYLRAPRASSVFPAPVRAALAGGTYAEVCNAHHHADGRRISRQAFSILSKIKEVDEVLSHRPALQGRVREIHPEVCFAVWNGGRAMRHRKVALPGARSASRLSTPCGRGSGSG